MLRIAMLLLLLICSCGPKLNPDCGNGLLEANKGEVCDDGNLINGDGCSSTCQLET